MKAKSGKKIEAIKPASPVEAFAADEADPGKLSKVKAKQVSTKTGKYGQTKAPAFKPQNASPANANGANSNSAAETNSEPKKETGWIALKLTDEANNAVGGEQYEVELPDGTVSKGSLDMNGQAKIEGFKPGQCKVRFPNLADGSVSAK